MRSLGILAAVTLAGAGTMVVELSAVRLLAPWFGTSAAVWTNVIGVVLLALAVGYLFGARLSHGDLPQRRMGLALLAGALSTVWLPFLASPLAGLFRPEGLALDRAAAILTWGSLASGVLLFFPAACALGCVGPLAVEAVDRRRDAGAGDAGGRVLAASTLGSLAGTFATTHWLLPTLGLNGTFLLAGGLLAGLGAVLTLTARRSRVATAALLVAVAAGLATSRVELPGATSGDVVLAEAQSAYQSLRVIERGEGEARMRLLQVNEGLDSFQSVWQPAPGWLPLGFYYNFFALPAWWEADRGDGEWRVCVLGLGTGTTWRVLEEALPAGQALVAHGVELDPQVVALGRAHMDLPPDGEDRLALAGWDARSALAQLPGPYDELVLDAYANQMEIPAHLCTREFFEEARAKLRPGGWLSINVGGFGLDDPVVRAVGATCAAAFERPVLGARVPFARNVVLFARRDADPPAPDDPAFLPEAAGFPRGLFAPLRLPGATALFEPEDGTVLTDDHCPMEHLQRRSVALAGESAGP